MFSLARKTRLPNWMRVCQNREKGLTMVQLPFAPHRKSCFCAFCRTPRKVYTARHVGFGNVILTAIASLLAMYVIWQKLDAKVTIVFVIFLSLAELFVELRWRLSMT